MTHPLWSFRAVAALIFCAAASGQPLRDLAARRAIRVGAAVDPAHLGDPGYASTLAREFSQAEPENAMKFASIHTAPTVYNFGPADAIVAFAADRGMAVRGHTLVWHNQLPSWLTNGGFTPDQLAGELQKHIQTVVGHYAGQVYAWDVVNEAFNTDGTLRSTIWSDSPGIGLAGTAYIEQAFRWAHDADPKALLFYNDYGAEGVNTKSDAIYKMAQDFRARGVPFDGVGLQMHLTSSGSSRASVEANMKRLTDLGLQVQITELDVRLPVDASGAASPAALATEAQIYRDVVEACLKFPKCTAVQTWGFTDRYSWIPGTYPGFGAALPFDTSYRTKPAYDAMAAALQTAPPVIASGALANAASYANDAIAPAEIVVLFGASYGPPELVTGGDVTDVRLLFDGDPAPVLYSQVGQVGAVVPASVAGKTSTTVQYEYGGVVSNGVSMPVKATVPGLFTLDSSGRGPGAILDSAYHVVSKSNPARHGDHILLYGTGGGISPADVSVAIGGVSCPVTYAGAAPGLVAGALQVNVQVDAGVPSGDQPVVLTIGATASQSGVTVAVE